MAPIPVQTAYAIPTGNVFKAKPSKATLRIMETPVKTDGQNFVNPSVYFKPTAQPISNNPATNKYIQDMFLYFFEAVPIEKKRGKVVPTSN
ncbi:hypothetical protein SAMN05443144_13019 [Fodinibius roseus]|uniref:Uncharacterized protein n=1 Tax=Fodinibius roseus TaxID=1194090 RepID=A0A1M5K9X6_9BACT|nr:hypothetical protein SAMN05443144_13019 [Fodinibius roseus]